MLLLDCPWCGKRDQTEFSYGGEAHIDRPIKPVEKSDSDWGQYVFFRANPKGYHRERWMHAQGCRRWFNLMRHTVTNEIKGSYKPGETFPPVSPKENQND
ncbi:MAG: sarcosine oxidase subunit delta [Rhodobacteraceae bacterium]|nr:sarcosine oxidase subunit delta [Paracoccaceae bacterium]